MITVKQLAVGLRMIAAESDDLDSGTTDILTRNLAASKARCESYLNGGTAPQDVLDQAILLYAGYLYEAGEMTKNSFSNSGAKGLLSPYRKRGAVV